MENKYAPIALFTYNRADHTQRAVESLLMNEEAKHSDLIIFSDGPRGPEKAQGVEENRHYISTVTGFRNIEIIEREENWGLSKNLISGITEITERYGRVIVVEDDLILSPYFLKYMNDSLEKYKDDDRVASICAFLNPVGTDVPETFFLRYFACWGWATWRRAWDILNTDSRELLKRLRWKKNDFNIGGTGPFYGILYCDKVGLNDSWAVRFYASCFLANKLHLYPGKTMAIQSGMDGSGTHCGTEDDNNPYKDMSVWTKPLIIPDIPVEEDRKMYKKYSAFYDERNRTPFIIAEYMRFKSFIRRLIGLDHI